MLLAEKEFVRLLSLPGKKKLAFLVLLYGRMTGELRAYCLTSSRDFSIFERAHAEFWGSLRGSASQVSWSALREEILNALPDSEHLGTYEAAVALYAGLVAADTAGFMEDGQDGHVRDAIRYALDSLEASVIHERVPELGVCTPEIYEDALSHQLVVRERRIEEEDIAFLEAIQDDPWPDSILVSLKARSEAQLGLLVKKLH